MTCTVWKMQSIVQEQYVKTSLGKISNLKPFFLTNPTEKEKNIAYVQTASKL